MKRDLHALKVRHPIEAVVSRYVTLHRSGRMLKARCPFHEERTASFFVDAASGHWQCYGRCATGGDVIDFLGVRRYGAGWNARDPAMFKAIVEELDGAPAPPSAAPRPRPAEPDDYHPVEMNEEAYLLLERAMRLYRARLWAMGAGPDDPLGWLRSRGFTDGTLRTANIGYCAGDTLMKYIRQTGVPIHLPRRMHLIDQGQGDREFLTGRFVFPELDPGGRVLHLAGRRWDPRLGDRAKKYLALKGVAKPLYGWARLDKTPSPRPVFLTESLTDGLMLQQWRLDRLVVLGTGLKPGHARLLARLERPLVCLPHNDGGTGLAAATKWQAAVGRGHLLLLPEMVKDINDLGLLPDGREIFCRLAAGAGFPI